MIQLVIGTSLTALICQETILGFTQLAMKVLLLKVVYWVKEKKSGSRHIKAKTLTQLMRSCSLNVIMTYACYYSYILVRIVFLFK